MPATASHPISVRAHRLTVWFSLALIGMLLLGNVPGIAAPLPFSLTPMSVAAQGTPCVDNSFGSYTSRTCITSPVDGSTVSGAFTAQVSVTAVNGSMPAINQVHYYLTPAGFSTSQKIATDYASPYTMVIPSERWVDGPYRIEVAVAFKDGKTTSVKASLMLTFANGTVTAPHSQGSWAPKTSGSSALHVVAVGDGAGGLSGTTSVGNRVSALNPDLFLYLGDVYDAGTYTEYVNYYGPTLGQMYGRTNPVPGNHEAKDVFQGYMDYWDSGSHYYSYDSGGWHFISLDSNVEFGQTAAGSAQYNWLAQDLLANAGTSCTVVSFHHPRYSLSVSNSYMQDIWSLMSLHGVDIVLAGHTHNYQRWVPMNADGAPDPKGIIQYVVGTGGHTLESVSKSDSRVAAANATNGVLSLTLGEGGGSSQFISASGAVLDQSSFTCGDGSTPPTPTPTSTPSPTATATPDVSGPSINLTPVADARVQEANPTVKYGTSLNLRADGGTDPDVETYLRFNVTGLTGAPTSAKLRLFVPSGATTGSVDGPAVYTSPDTTWSETSITWATKPPRSTVALDDLGAVSPGTWVEYDVTAAINGNGLYTFALATNSTDATDFASRETSTSPQLMLSGGNATPTLTASATPSPTATNTPVPTATATPPAGVPYLPAADASVLEARPLDNVGTEPQLTVVGGTGDAVESYVRFNVTDFTGPYDQVTLQVYIPEDATPTGTAPSLYLASSNAWSETGISWANRPPRSTAPVIDTTASGPGSWVVYDLTSVVITGGEYTFVLATTSTQSTTFTSRETATSPRLVFSGGLPNATPTPTETTSTPEASPTATVTPMPSATSTPEPTATNTPEPTPTSTPEPTATSTPPPTPTSTPEPTATATPDLSGPLPGVAPVADARVEEANPTGRYGAGSILRADGGTDPDVDTYLRFNVTGLTGAPTSARVRLFVPNGVYTGSTDGPAIYTSTNTTWAETSITWSNRPPRSTVALDDLGAVSPGTWVEYDVTAAITGNGTYTFVLASVSTDATDFASRETSTPPELILQGTGGSQSSTTSTSSTVARSASIIVEPTADVTKTPAPTPTVMATATATSTVTATTTPPTPSPTATEQVLTGTVVNTGGQGLRCRDGASVDANVITVLVEGETVVIRGPQEGDWLPVVCAGQDGYVASAWIAVNEPTSGVTPDAPPTATTTTATEPSSTGPTPTSTSIATIAAMDQTPPAEPPATTVAPTADAGPTPFAPIGGWQENPAIPWWWMTDDDLQTIWSGTVADAQDKTEFGFDLGSIQPVSHLRWQPTWPMQGTVEIRLSLDGVTWYKLTTLNLQQIVADQWHDIPVNTQTRYIAFIVANPASGGTVGAIREIEVWPEPTGSTQRLDRFPLVTPEPAPTEPVVAPTEPPPPPTQAPPPTEPPIIPTPVPTEPPPPPTPVPTPEPPPPPPPTPVPTPVPTLPPEPTAAPPPVEEPPPAGG